MVFVTQLHAGFPGAQSKIPADREQVDQVLLQPSGEIHSHCRAVIDGVRYASDDEHGAMSCGSNRVGHRANAPHHLSEHVPLRLAGDTTHRVRLEKDGMPEVIEDDAVDVIVPTDLLDIPERQTTNLRAAIVHCCPASHLRAIALAGDEELRMFLLKPGH